jgi:hypothetical protein
VYAALSYLCTLGKRMLVAVGHAGDIKVLVHAALSYLGIVYAALSYLCMLGKRMLVAVGNAGDINKRVSLEDALPPKHQRVGTRQCGQRLLFFKQKKNQYTSQHTSVYVSIRLSS